MTAVAIVEPLQKTHFHFARSYCQIRSKVFDHFIAIEQSTGHVQVKKSVV